MYRYDELDQAFVDQRVAEFRDQTRRHLAGQLSEDEFRPLRLRNGLYIQRHAPMLRIAIPYGLLASRQLRKLADIARRYDRGYGHFTTRQNLQLNWPNLADVPDILAELATVQMHAIQTSGNCVRNVTADHLAGIARDEIDDPRPYCEIIRQWATLHPEFTYLPRKFKIAVTGSPEDRAASEVHDIGLHLARDARGNIGFTVLVGGGLGRAPRCWSRAWVSRASASRWKRNGGSAARARRACPRAKSSGCAASSGRSPTRHWRTSTPAPAASRPSRPGIATTPVPTA